MNKEERRNKIQQLSDREDNLIKLISESGDEELMDAFIDWQSLRTELNEETLKYLEEELKRDESKRTH